MAFRQQEHFSDRADAGRRLAAEIAALGPDRPVIYALPRGGVPVAVEVARALRAPLDLILVRKIGAPGAPELALGAIVDGEAPQIVINEEVRKHSRASDAFLARARDLELREIERRRARYMAGRAQIDPRDRIAIIVDDGLATGATMKAALIGIRKRGPSEVWIAVPVAPTEVIDEMQTLADRVICLRPERLFLGVGAFYDDFHQLTDDEVLEQLRSARRLAACTDSVAAAMGDPGSGAIASWPWHSLEQVGPDSARNSTMGSGASMPESHNVRLAGVLARRITRLAVAISRTCWSSRLGGVTVISMVCRIARFKAPSDLKSCVSTVDACLGGSS